MSPKITVFTSLIGQRDGLREDQDTREADFVAFVDRPWGSTVWRERPGYRKFASPRRNARTPKILAHQFVTNDYSLWLDGRVALRVPAARLVEEWLSDHDIALFHHPKRNCLYAEAKECADRELDDPQLLREQVERYEQGGFGLGRGLAETCIILRRHTSRVEALNNLWWSELCRYSVRDQVSFMYAADRAGISVKLVPSDIRRHPYFDVSPRAAQAEPRD